MAASVMDRGGTLVLRGRQLSELTAQQARRPWVTQVLKFFSMLRSQKQNWERILVSGCRKQMERFSDEACLQGRQGRKWGRREVCTQKGLVKPVCIMAKDH